MDLYTWLSGAVLIHLGVLLFPTAPPRHYWHFEELLANVLASTSKLGKDKTGPRNV